MQMKSRINIKIKKSKCSLSGILNARSSGINISNFESKYERLKLLKSFKSFDFNLRSNALKIQVNLC